VEVNSSSNCECLAPARIVPTTSSCSLVRKLQRGTSYFLITRNPAIPTQVGLPLQGTLGFLKFPNIAFRIFSAQFQRQLFLHTDLLCQHCRWGIYPAIYRTTRRMRCLIVNLQGVDFIIVELSRRHQRSACAGLVWRF